MKQFAIISPAPIRGSGGVARIFNFADALTRAGFKCDVYVFDAGSKSKEQLKKEALDYYGAQGFDVYCGAYIEEHYDYVMATRWDTAKLVRDSSAKNKLYLVQDFEACFSPVGDGTVFAENSYLYDLQTITYGKWLATKLNRQYGNQPYFLDFSSDLNSFFVKREYEERLKGRPSICFIYQHDKPRRCPQLGIEALGIVKSMRPDVEIVLVGTDQSPPLWFEYTNAGLLNLEGLNELYNKCHVGLCLSSSNPSCNPFDMMAAGLPSVELYRDNNLYDLPEGGVLLAHQTPESIAEAILFLLSDNETLKRMSEFGVNFMKARGAEQEVISFLSIVNDVGSGTNSRQVTGGKIPARYSLPAVVAPACQGAAVEAHVQDQFNCFRDDMNLQPATVARVSSHDIVKTLSHPPRVAHARSRILVLAKRILRRLGV
ncbi:MULTISPECIES: glycosyl transferase family 1 [Pseudomonas]|uniref:rhamnosyltransferase WsaF family glycosyltransferase n=1 Tax=Pseudomonas TaxID=286 RepID=UPI000B23E7C9|nr:MULTISPECIES: glycosyl transferase family 1 [Pseudomonas]UUT21631.1 hypothetical protein NRG23_28640 [Pseudomonas sp. T8]